MNGINIDFTKDNYYPAISQREFKLIHQKVNKQIRFKLDTINRNLIEHKELDIKLYSKMIYKALYNNYIILPSITKDKPNYYNFIAKLDNIYYVSLVLDTDPKKEYFEIVHVLKTKRNGIRKVIRKIKKIK
ncbi:MAG: hypothetical protein Ta2D_04010 [Rickettsiales bacterium]|nr:MAG: hypothetical protein Ta2D_04010 [Rickettsiales bacterium]